ncbi:MAG: HEAT repeat domain-containing protein, partial [Planctomycetota bacterium]
GYGDPYEGPKELFTDEYKQARRLDDGSPLRYANGLLVYRPDLGEGARDFDAGVFAQQGVDSKGPGFGPSKAGRVARADFRIRLPYVIAGWPGDIVKPDDVSGAAVISGRFRRARKSDRVRALLSVDNGGTWREIWTAGRTGESEFAADFSPLVEGRYDYIVRFEMLAAGLPGDARVLSFGLDTACQLNPATLPAVRPGKNRMTVTFESGPEVFDETVQYYDRAAHERLLVSSRDVQISKGSYPALGPRKRGRLANVVYAMRAPKGRRIRWAKAGGAFRSHWDVAAAPDETYRIYYSIDRPGRWKLLWEADRAPYLGHWCFETDRSVPLRRGAKAVFVKYELKRSRLGGGGGKMIAARMAWGCSPERGSGAGAGVRVTHKWQQGKTGRSESCVVRKSGESYAFKAGRGVRNSSVTVEFEGRAPVEDGPHPLMLESPNVERKPVADAKKIAAMRAALRRLEKKPTAATAADLMRNGPHNWVRNTMAPALMAIGTPEAIAELKKAVGENAAAEDCWLEMLAHRGPLEDLTVRLKKTGPQHRAKAARLLGVRGEAGAIPALRAAVAKEKNARALAEECAALVRCAGSDAAGEVLAVLPGMGVRDRVRVAEALAATGIPEGFATLGAALGDGNRYVRFEAARALKRSGRSEAERPLLRALRDRCRWTRREAIAGLGRLGGPKALRALEKVEGSDRQEDLRAEARWALTEIRARASSGKRRHK